MTNVWSCQETYDLVINQIDINIQDIDELRVDLTHGVDISSQLNTLKQEFNFVTRFYRDLSKLYKDPYRHGMFFNEETNKYELMYLGQDEQSALGRMNHVKSFLM